MELIIDFFKDLDRLGPGSDEQTLKALEMMQYDPNDLKIIDMGCGTGSQTMALTKATGTEITAIDCVEPFLHTLNRRFSEANLKVNAAKADMSKLLYRRREFDIIWSEGSIYFIGFFKGISYWYQFLKPNGYLALTEITWLTDTRPEEVDRYWSKAYSEITTINENVKSLTRNGYKVVNTFVLPETCWDNYYSDIQRRLDDFAKKHNNSDAVKKFIEEEKGEMQVYNTYKKYYGSVFYIAQKV